MSIPLSELISAISTLSGISGNLAGIDVAFATPDSREVAPGALFCAMKGARLDGHDFIPEAIAKGASVILAEHPCKAIPDGFPLILVSDAYHAFGEVAEAVARKPADAFRTVAVTGTNGKTTSAYLLRAILKAAGHSTGMIGTVEYDVGLKTMLPADRTTPTPFQLQKLFSSMKENGVEYNVMEVSSHALAQGRLGTLRASCALFTNLTQDHLDYHRTMEEYFQAKRLLFTRHLEADAPVVINADNPYGQRLAAEFRGSPRLYALSFKGNPEATVTASGLSLNSDGADFTLQFPDGDLWENIHTPLPGEYNAVNVAGALCAAKALGIPKEKALAAVASCKGAPGRMQAVTPIGNPFSVFVDYAHTDDALKNALATLQALPHRRLMVLFGCGGDRDRAKRPLMARAAAEYADVIYVTSDNPRTERPSDIIADILPGFPEGIAPVVLEDRKEAICRAISDASSGDILLIAGKGHEDYQEINGVKHHFNDAEVASLALESGR